MNLDEFRKTPRLVRGASKLMESPVFREMLKVLWEEHPLNKPSLRALGPTPEDPSYQLGTIDGGNRVLQVLNAMASPFKEGHELKATYEPREE